MKADSLIRLLPLSFALSILTSAAVYLSGYPEGALGVLLGGVWSTANFWAIYKLFFEAFFGRRPILAMLWLQLKVPVLYGLGYIFMKLLTFDFIWAIVGFHIPFMIFMVWGIFQNYKTEKTCHSDGCNTPD
jgi:hypothetical protein